MSVVLILLQMMKRVMTTISTGIVQLIDYIVSILTYLTADLFRSLFVN